MGRQVGRMTDLIRLQVAARDGVICQYCGDEAACEYHIDHVIPFVLGGPCALYNLVMACDACNERKNDGVWVPRNLDAITADQPAWRARIIELAAPGAAAALSAGTTRQVRAWHADTALAAEQEQVIEFFGEPWPVSQTPDGTLYVALRPLATRLGLSWQSQWERLTHDEVLAGQVRRVLTRGADGRRCELLCLPLDLIPGWLFGITPARVRPELREKITQYRQHCFVLLSHARSAV